MSNSQNGSLAAGIAALSSAAGTYAQAVSGRKAQRRAHRYNLEMANFQYGKDLESWNRANAYNDPTQQMARLKRAGLNPNLVYGNGATTQAAGQLPQFQAPQMDMGSPIAPDWGGVLGETANVALKAAQRDNIQAQTANTEQNTFNSALKSEIIKTDAQRKKVDLHQIENLNPYSLQIRELQTRQESQKLANLAKTGKLTDSKRVGQEAENTFKKYRNELNKMGIHTTDALPYRIGYKLWQEYGGNLMDFIRKVQNSKNNNYKF
ncbi:hypothetical protein [Microviridae sp.]|nr:hypothetical protein [Microviridae sp.]